MNNEDLVSILASGAGQDVGCGDQRQAERPLYLLALSFGVSSAMSRGGVWAREVIQVFNYLTGSEYEVD